MSRNILYNLDHESLLSLPLYCFIRIYFACEEFRHAYVHTYIYIIFTRVISCLNFHVSVMKNDATDLSRICTQVVLHKYTNYYNLRTLRIFTVNYKRLNSFVCTIRTAGVNRACSVRQTATGGDGKSGLIARHFFEAAASFARLNIGASTATRRYRSRGIADQGRDKNDGHSLACRGKARAAHKVRAICGIARIRLIQTRC